MTGLGTGLCGEGVVDSEGADAMGRELEAEGEGKEVGELERRHEGDGAEARLLYEGSGFVLCVWGREVCWSRVYGEGKGVC